MRLSIIGVATRVGVGILALVINGCESNPHRKLANEQEAVAQFFAHRDYYQELAEDWLASGHQNLYWFGWTNFHQQLYTWNDYWVRPSWWWREVTHWDGQSYIVERAATFEETARMSGTSGEEVSRWHRKMASLGFDSITTMSATRGGTHFAYVEIEYFPVRHPYGFRFAPRSDGTAQRELMSWANQIPPPRHKVDSLGSGWFYYQGMWPRDLLPFARVR